MSATYALAIPESSGAPRPATYGTRAQLAAGNGDVEGYLALTGCDSRAGTASYALRIVNQSDYPLRARMICATLRGEAILAYPLDVHIAPFSISETLLPIRLADVGPYDRAIVHIEGGAIAFSLEAPAPARKAKKSRWIIAAAAGIALALTAGFAAASTSPHIGVLDVPARVFAGTSIDVPYGFRGWASLEYTLRTRDGRRLAAGLTNAHEGTMHFSVPSTAGSDVVLAVDLVGPFGQRTQTKMISISPQAPVHKTIAAAPAAAPHISAFAVANSNVRAGDTLYVKYITNAGDGDIWLIDGAGQLWARSAISPAGETAISVPRAAAGRQMRVVLHARNGGADAVASVAVTILPGAVDAQPVGENASASATLSLSADRVAPGELFTVTVNGPHTDALVTLTDKNGNQIEQGDVPPGQDAVSLTAPSTGGVATYFVTANVTQGVGQQTIVRKLTVAPPD